MAEKQSTTGKRIADSWALIQWGEIMAGAVKSFQAAVKEGNEEKIRSTIKSMAIGVSVCRTAAMAVSNDTGNFDLTLALANDHREVENPLEHDAHYARREEN